VWLVVISTLGNFSVLACMCVSKGYFSYDPGMRRLLCSQMIVLRRRQQRNELPYDMQDYDFKKKFESLPDSTTRLDTRGLLTRTGPIGSSCLSYLVSTKEEVHSKDIHEAHKAQHAGLE
jgi:hypothetical protein